MTRQKIIIFDFNRTLYDPDTAGLVADVHEVLTELRERGWSLYLLSHAEGGRREGLITSLGLMPYFVKVIISENKDLGDFKTIITPNIDAKNSWVVGDYVKKEIYFGNQCGLKTIWVRAGKFANVFPNRPEEEPTASVMNLRAVLEVI